MNATSIDTFPTAVQSDVAGTARYLAVALCEGKNDIGEAVEVLATWDAERPGILRAAAVAQATGTVEDLAMALIFEAAATARA